MSGEVAIGSGGARNGAGEVVVRVPGATDGLPASAVGIEARRPAVCGRRAGKQAVRTMRRRLGIAAAMAFGLLAAARPALAQGMVPPMPDPRGGQGSLVLHQPIQSGGPAADTAFLDMLGNPFWQQVSDNILIPESGTVRQIVWWGFYNLDNPPAEETMRVRSCGRFDGAECFLRHQEGLFKDTILSGNTDGMRAPVVLREWIADVRGGRMV